MYDKILPHNKDAELAVIGSMILNKQAISKAILILEYEHFYSEINQKLFIAIVELYVQGINVDFLSLSDKLKKNKTLDFVGGVVFITEVTDKVPTSANVETYAKIVYEEYLKRKLIEITRIANKKLYDVDSDPFKKLEELESDILEIKAKIPRGTLTPKQIAIKLIDRTEALNAGKIKPINLGFETLDKTIGGLLGGDIVYIGARPSQGKTALGTTIANYLWFNCNKPVAFISLESSDIPLTFRLMAARKRIDIKPFRIGKMQEGNIKAFYEFLSEFSRAGIYIKDPSSLTSVGLFAMLKELKERNKIELAIVDYMQLIKSDEKYNNREQQVAAISRAFKQTAKYLNIPLIGMVQLNREVDKRSHKTPQMSDFRETGQFEQDADVILLIERPEKYNILYYPANDLLEPNGETKGKADIIIAKHREGACGFERVRFYEEYTKFESIDYKHEELPF